MVNRRYKNGAIRNPSGYTIEHLEIDRKSKHRVSVWKKIIAVPFPFDRSRENLEPRTDVAYRRSMVEDRVTHRFFLLFLLSLEKKPIRSTTDWLSIPSSYLLRQRELSKKKGGKKEKKKNTKKRRERDRLLCEPSLLSGQIEFLQSWRGRGGRKGCTESVQEWKRHDLFLSRTQHRKVRFFCSMQKVSGIVEGFRGAERKVRRKGEGDGYPKGWKERRKASRLRKKVQSASRLILEEERYTDLVSAQRLSVVSHSISWR